MTRERYLQLIAEEALASGRPLHQELELAHKEVGSTPGSAAALAAARAGSLVGALQRLGFDPLVAAIARARPEATVEVARKLKTLPAKLESMITLQTALAYFGLVLIVELFVNVVLRYAQPVIGGSFAPALAAVRVALGVLFLAAVFLVPRAAAAIEVGRALAASSVLVAHGVAPADVLRIMNAAGIRRFRRIEPLFAASAHDPLMLDRLALMQAATSERALARDLRVVRAVGTFLVLVPAFLLLTEVYGGIGQLGLSAGRP